MKSLYVTPIWKKETPFDTSINSCQNFLSKEVKKLNRNYPKIKTNPPLWTWLPLKETLLQVRKIKMFQKSLHLKTQFTLYFTISKNTSPFSSDPFSNLTKLGTQRNKDYLLKIFGEFFTNQVLMRKGSFTQCWASWIQREETRSWNNSAWKNYTQKTVWRKSIRQNRF